MPCNCGKKKKYLVIKGDGSQETVDTLSAAMAMIRKHGGRWQPVKV